MHWANINWYFTRFYFDIYFWYFWYWVDILFYLREFFFFQFWRFPPVWYLVQTEYSWSSYCQSWFEFYRAVWLLQFPSVFCIFFCSNWSKFSLFLHIFVPVVWYSVLLQFNFLEPHSCTFMALLFAHSSWQCLFSGSLLFRPSYLGLFCLVLN